MCSSKYEFVKPVFDHFRAATHFQPHYPSDQQQIQTVQYALVDVPWFVAVFLVVDQSQLLVVRDFLSDAEFVLLVVNVFSQEFCFLLFATLQCCWRIADVLAGLEASETQY